MVVHYLLGTFFIGLYWLNLRASAGRFVFLVAKSSVVKTSAMIFLNICKERFDFVDVSVFGKQYSEGHNQTGHLKSSFVLVMVPATRGTGLGIGILRTCRGS